MENEKLLNNILLIVILLLIANYLSGGSILNILKKYYQKIIDLCSNIEGFGPAGEIRLFEGLKTCDKTTPPVVHDNDFKQTYQKNIKNEDPNMRKLYHFLQSLITVNNNHYDLTTSQQRAATMSQNDKETLTKFILKTFNCGDFKFTNLVILDSIIYFENPKGKELRPFRISTDAYINNVPIGKITLHLEVFNRLDSTFYGPFNSGFPTFTRIKLIRKDKIASLPPPMEGSNDYEELNASDNSLIPDSINFSTENNSETSSFSR